MTQPTDHDKRRAPEFPRRVRISAVEIGLAVALTFAALLQLISSLSQRDSKTGETAAYVRPAK